MNMPSGSDHRCRLVILLAVLSLAFATGCRTVPRVGSIAPRRGDEIVVAGKFVHTGAPVVTWMDPGGYDAYRVERRFSPIEDSDWDKSKAAVKDLSSPNRYNRRGGLTPEAVERVRGGGWDLPTLQGVVDQFVLHYDVCGTSRQCFKVLQDLRGLSVHFMLDLDGTIYQTLDVKERAWHATTSNSRSVGIEIANMGAYSRRERSPLAEWYTNDGSGTRITIPARFGNGGIRTKDFVGHPARPEPVKGVVQGTELTQYDFTPQQYDSLAKLTAALCTVLPKIQCDYPRDAAGHLVTKKLPDNELNAYQGVLGHYHIQTNKTDPGPALQWDWLMTTARKLMGWRPSEPTCERGATLLIR
jgi:N-acetylmuramoyl-L-alanine amidase